MWRHHIKNCLIILYCCQFKWTSSSLNQLNVNFILILFYSICLRIASKWIMKIESGYFIMICGDTTQKTVVSWLLLLMVYLNINFILFYFILFLFYLLYALRLSHQSIMVMYINQTWI